MTDPFAEDVTKWATSRQLDRLLALANDDTQSIFSATLSDRPGLAKSLEQLSAHTPQPSQDWLSAVGDDHATIATLREIKAFAQVFIKKATCESERVAATLLYHATVASAWARHGENISTRSLANRGPLYEDLADIMKTDPLGRIFREAADRLIAAHDSWK